MQRNVFLSAALLCSAVIGTSINAEGKSVEELKKAGDFRGLVAKLGDHRAVVRREAAVALSVVVMRLERVDLLRPRVPDLLAATFKDPDEGVRKYAERALQHTLLKLDHEPTLTIAAHPLAAQDAVKGGMERSKKLGNWRGLVARLKDKNSAVRRQAA